MGADLLRFPHKAIRAEVIKRYMKDNGFPRAVCYSCGNASKALADAGVETLAICTAGDLTANRWFTPAEIARIFPTHFDATSGHLSVELMYEIGKAYAEHLGELPAVTYVPTGSGETLVCLKMVYPETDFVAVYNLDKATEYNENATLNPLVRALAVRVEFAKGV